MTTTKATPHTPGPWHARNDEPNRLLIAAPWSQDVRPGDAYGMGDYRGIHVCNLDHNGTVESQEQIEANARLIAAAPELLSQLMSVATWLVAPALDAETLGQIKAECIAVIAKATHG